MVNSSFIAIYVIETDKRVSLNQLHISPTGKITGRNNWTFDILSEKLFQAILYQIIRKNEAVKDYVIGLPGAIADDRIRSSDFFDVSLDFYSKIEQDFQIRFIFMNDIDTAIHGYAKEGKEKNNRTITGIYLPTGYDPGAGIIIHDNNHFGSACCAGEIKYIHPDICWETLPAVIFKIILI